MRRILPRPRPRSVSCWPGLRPAPEPVCVTRTRFLAQAFGCASWLRRGLARGPNNSATFLPRRFATDRGEAHRCSAANVALTMLCGLRLPSDLATTSPIPSDSNTARSGPPAMMPGAGRRRAQHHRCRRRSGPARRDAACGLPSSARGSCRAWPARSLCGSLPVPRAPCRRRSPPGPSGRPPPPARQTRSGGRPSPLSPRG